MLWSQDRSPPHNGDLQLCYSCWDAYQALPFSLITKEISYVQDITSEYATPPQIGFTGICTVPASNIAVPYWVGSLKGISKHIQQNALRDLYDQETCVFMIPDHREAFKHVQQNSLRSSFQTSLFKAVKSGIGQVELAHAASHPLLVLSSNTMSECGQ